MNFGSLISFIVFIVLMSGTVGSPARETVASQRKKLPTGVDIDPVGRMPTRRHARHQAVPTRLFLH
jgi:hypothetical protein